MEIDPVPRDYLGVMFRSTLEADWAATLDSLSIKWAYEPEGIQLPSGAAYVPDFHLPEIGTWIEIKGPEVPGVEKAREFAQTRVCRCEADCACQWPGGEIVLLGLPSLRRYGPERLRYGAMAWDDAIGGNALLGLCPECEAYSWVRPRHSLSCRRCGRRFDGHLFNTGDLEFRRADRYRGYA